jgi:hypothetical protein
MKRCLTDRALTRVLAELGTPDEHAHLAACLACAARYRRLQNEMTEIADVLAATPGPRVPTIPASRRWIAAAAALAAVVAGVWLSWETGSPVRPGSPRDPQVTTAMADITSVLFSVDGEPRRRAVALEPNATPEADCDTSAPTTGMYCTGGTLGLGEGPLEGRDEGG